MKQKIVGLLPYNKHVVALDKRNGWELVLLGASLLDVALDHTIRFALSEWTKADRDRFMRGSAQDLSSRIDVAHVLGITSARTARESHLFRNLRNTLAHSIDVDTLAHPNLLGHIEKFGYHDREALEPTDLGPRAGVATIEEEPRRGFVDFFGLRVEMEDVDLVRDSAGRIGFFVPTSRGADFSDPEVKTRHQIWSCILATVASEIPGWGAANYNDGHPGT
jgi:hypothetical protein